MSNMDGQMESAPETFCWLKTVRLLLAEAVPCWGGSPSKRTWRRQWEILASPSGLMKPAVTAVCWGSHAQQGMLQSITGRHQVKYLHQATEELQL